MAYRLLLDENIEREVGRRLTAAGHDVRHIDEVPELGKGSDDNGIASYSRSSERAIVTYDSHFVVRIDEETFDAVLYIGDSTVSPKRLADRLTEMARHYPQSELDGVEYVGSMWD